MQWTPKGKSKHLEDRRGQPASGRAKAGGAVGAGALLLALLGYVFGVEIPLGETGPDPAHEGPAPGYQPAPSEETLVAFVSFVLDDVQNTFARKFQERGLRYEFATLQLFTRQTESGCGYASADIGPFYCPPDKKAYIDLRFYQDLHTQFGAPGDFAQAYVIAHELGHHLQNIMGIDANIDRQTRANPARKNELSIRQELQADCFAGVWAHSTKARDILDRGDPEEALNAASAVGDDRLQRQAGTKINPETWTHGSSAQRVHWFNVGMASGSLDSCFF